MTPEISERSFEDAIECALLEHGPDACLGDALLLRVFASDVADRSTGCAALRSGSPNTH